MSQNLKYIATSGLYLTNQPSEYNSGTNRISSRHFIRPNDNREEPRSTLRTSGNMDWVKFTIDLDNPGNSSPNKI